VDLRASGAHRISESVDDQSENPLRRIINQTVSGILKFARIAHPPGLVSISLLCTFSRKLPNSRRLT
jgi:hypothetical protein